MMNFKSLSKKLNIFKTSPLISAIAVLEVIILICVSTFAWFVFAENNQINTSTISVEPDSGLEIDFNEADSNDYVNIWNYLNEFQFEPVTSLDGRNIFIPTTGTFNSTNTSDMVFREGTVNDMNSKYINIDFSLTNTDVYDMDVYLSSQSYFKFDDSANGKALRLAFYQNDGSSGAITSALLSKEYDGDTPEDPDDPSGGEDGGGTYTVYLDAPSKWESSEAVWVYLWNTSTGINNASFPGVAMDYNSSTGLFSFTCEAKYNKVIFSSWPSGDNSRSQTVDLDLYDEGTYTLVDDSRTGTWAMDDIAINGGTKVDGNGSNSGSNSGGSSDTGDSEGKTTVYFYNTLGWEQPYAYIWNKADDKFAIEWPGQPMTNISGDIYYYTFDSYYDSIIFNDGNSEGGAVKTGDINPVKDGYIYMIGSPNASNSNIYDYTVENYIGTVDGGTYPVISPGVSTGFQRPYAPVTQIENNSGSAQVIIPAFASSIDDYNYGSKKLFTIKAGQTLSLSMIVWLEGTDPDCTAETYAGKDIDMNLVFATKHSGEEMYTYRFLDKTKENWIDDKITTDTGVSFNPVMQLYDVDNQKGYLMHLEEGSKTNWTVQAPQSLIKSTHIMFRRVNPMNEDEVWNYWDTYGFANSEYGAVQNYVVTFSAFSDGAPTNAENDESDKQHNAPARSCGGLWGDHETQIVTVYDGTEGHWIKDSLVEGTTSVLTMNYTYKGQTVEYKASGARDMYDATKDKGLYYFVVPMDVYSKKNGDRPDITFKRYYNFNEKYALNSDFNSLTYHTSWKNGKCQGKFFEITGSAENDCYWGSDMLYVQVKNAVKSKIDGSHLQVHFYGTNDGSEDDSQSHYTTLYRQDFYAAKNDGYGYACVVPSNRDYYFYRVERCESGKTSNKWNITPLQTVDNTASTNGTDNNDYSNTVGENICAIDYMYLNVYLEVPKKDTNNWDMSNKDWPPEYHIWKQGGSAGNTYPGDSMTFVKDESVNGNSNYCLFKCTLNISYYDYVLFSNEYGGTQHNFGGDLPIGTTTDYNGMVYRVSGAWSGTINMTLQSDRIGPNEVRNETLHVTLYPAEGWDKNGD